MSELGDDLKAIRKAQQERRAKRLPIRQEEIEDLTKDGYVVKKLTDYQYRVNDIFDIYPIHRRWHHLKTNSRGYYTAGKLLDFIKSNIKL